jgi:hypothetical protein
MNLQTKVDRLRADSARATNAEGLWRIGYPLRIMELGILDRGGPSLTPSFPLLTEGFVFQEIDA